MSTILTFSLIIVLVTIGSGIYLYLKGIKTDKKTLKSILKFNLFAFIPTVTCALFIIVPDAVIAASSANSLGAGLGYLGAALSTGLATIGAGIAVGNVGASAIGAVSEDESFLGKTLIFLGLAEGIAIYGIIISILILVRL